MGKKKKGPVARTRSASSEEPAASPRAASREEEYERFKTEATELFQATLDFYHRYQPPEGRSQQQPWVSCLWPISCLSISFDFDPTGGGSGGKSEPEKK